MADTQQAGVGKLPVPCLNWSAAVEAKREDTRQRRLAQAVEWLAEGKARHWKYQR